MLNVTMDSLFLDAVRRVPTRTFARFVDAQITYGDAARRVAAAAAALAAAGVKPRDRVGCYADDVESCLWFMLAAATAGAVLIPMGPRHSVRALGRLVERTTSVAVFTTRAHAAAVAELGVRTLVHAGPEPVPAGCVELPVTGGATLEQALDVLTELGAQHGPDDPYIMLSTSGTTSEPKLVVRAHRTYASLALPMLLGVDRDGEPQRVMMAAALTHGIGHANLALGLYLAAELACPRRIEAQVTLDEVRALDPTYLYSSPRVINTLIQQFDAERAAGGTATRILGPRCRIIRLGGGPSTPKSRQVFADQGLDIGEVYSSTECASIAITPFGGKRMEILPDIEVKISPDQELLVRTPRGMIGYHGAPDLTRAAYTEDGFYRTGDRGEIEDGRYLKFLSRKHEAFNTPDGDNINPVWIEGMVEVLPWVEQVVLIGDRRPYITALVVVADPPGSGDGADGFLAPGAFPELHARVRKDLAILNERLEVMEQVRRVALFARRFPEDAYRAGSAGKTRRDRQRIEAEYADRITTLYAEP